MRADSKPDRRQERAALTRQSLLYGGLAVAALTISAVNVLAILRLLWNPAGALALPVYLLFAAASLLAAVSFLRTRSHVLQYRDHPDQLDEESMGIEESENP
jgi:hypothetical protein